MRLAFVPVLLGDRSGPREVGVSARESGVSAREADVLAPRTRTGAPAGIR